MAYDLHTQYGNKSAFKGWYLTYETRCIDVGTNYYKPVGEYLKNVLSPGKKVIISPIVNAKVCVNVGTYKDALINLQSAVDYMFYQDAIGAGTLFPSGNSKYTYDDENRCKRLKDSVKTYFNPGPSTVPQNITGQASLVDLQANHRLTTVVMGINAEAWEKSTQPYETTPSKAGNIARINTQLGVYNSKLSLQPVMLNEVFLQFEPQGSTHIVERISTVSQNAWTCPVP